MWDFFKIKIKNNYFKPYIWILLVISLFIYFFICIFIFIWHWNGNKLSFQPYIPVYIQIQELKLPSSFLLMGNRNGNKIFITIP